MKISLITTVLNEETSITEFLESIKKQSKKADEIIFVDGGSVDATVEKINDFRKRNRKLNIKTFLKKGNRSVGRNEAVKKAKNDIIAIADAGTVLDKNWLKNITSPFEKRNVKVVAGYYQGKAKNTFQKCIVPYVLVMPDKINKKTFLPATRSMAIRKNTWEGVGRFDEKLNHNEDYEFAKRLEKAKTKIYFQKSAIVFWTPVSSARKAFRMFYRFALGDVEAKILRPKVFFIFLRYSYLLYFIFLFVLYKSYLALGILAGSSIMYIIWAIFKNYRYVRERKAIFYLPFIQFISDISVMLGSLMGGLKLLREINFFEQFKNHLGIMGILLIYSVIIFSSFNWGAPNRDHLYPYHMDEWHQFKSVVNTYAQGTSNTEGSANGTMFHFTLSGIYLAPFAATGIIDQSMTIEDYSQKERLFTLLRLNTFIYGFFSIVALFILFKKLRLNSLILSLLFIFSPVFLLLSGYFKYDIALLFWIILSVLFSMNYSEKPNRFNLFIAGISPAIAISVKVSALPLLPIFFLMYLIFSKHIRRDIIYFLISFLNLIFLIVILGFPDTIFGKGNIYFYLYDNIVNVPKNVSGSLNIGINEYQYLFFSQYPFIFGYGLIAIFIISVITLLIKYKKFNRQILFILASFILFLISLMPLGLVGTGNRSLVLLPYILLIAGFGLSWLIKKNKIFLILATFVIFIQLFQVLGWVRLKNMDNPQSESSKWILQNIPRNEIIGIENIPIYQRLPDVVEKEYDLLPYEPNNKYRYEIIDEKTKKFPRFIILSNADFDSKYINGTPKEKILKNLKKNGYTQVYISNPDLRKIYFGDEKDYYFSTLLPSPVAITIYRK